MAALTPKQERFVREYLRDLNATQAAIRAGYSAKGATVTGSKLLANPKVREFVTASQRKVAKKLDLTAEKVLRDIIRISQKAEKVGDLGVALKGRELLGKRLKLFTDRVEVEGRVTLEQLVAGSMQKPGES